MMFTVVLVSLIYLTGQQGVHCGNVNEAAGSFKLIRHELCEDQGTGGAIRQLIILNNSTDKSLLQGFLTVPFDFDNNVHSEMNISKLGSSGWQSDTLKMKSKHFCSDFQLRSPRLFQFFLKSWGIKNPSCPIKAGNYTINMETDLPTMSFFPFITYGTYRIHQALSYGNPPVRMVCNVWYVTSSE